LITIGLPGFRRHKTGVSDFLSGLMQTHRYSMTLVKVLRFFGDRISGSAPNWLEKHMSQVTLRINGESHTLEVSPDMPLLWALRDKLNMTGTRYGCGIGLCGTCTVLADGEPVQSCLLPAASMAGREITTIEGLSPDGSHPVQIAWDEEDVPQCGYCQGGQVLTAVALLESNPEPDDEAIDKAMAGVLCRCGTYFRIRKAIKRAAGYCVGEGGAA